jgi:hypothetical protein
VEFSRAYRCSTNWIRPLMLGKMYRMLIRINRILFGISLILICALFGEAAGQDESDGIRARELNVSNDPNDHPSRNYQRDIFEKALMDSIMYRASNGVMGLEKITYRRSIGDLDIPAYIFPTAYARWTAEPTGSCLGPRRCSRKYESHLFTVHQRSCGTRLCRDSSGLPR